MMSTVAVKEQRRRDLTAVAVALLFHLLVVGAFILSNLLFFNDVEDYRGPVLVKLGRADAPVEEAEALPATPVESVEQPESNSSDPVESVEEQKSGAPEETVKPEESESENAREVPVSEEESGDSGQAEESSQSSEGETGTAPADAPPADVEEIVTVTSGREEGNAYETTYEATPGLVGRTLGDAIYLYMPVPQFVTLSVFESLKDDPVLVNRTSDKKRSILEGYYEQFGTEYLLKDQTQPSYDDRPQIWSLLAEGGVDLTNPEYKNVSPRLRDLVITFIVEVGDDATVLSNVQVSRSSGNSQIDEAVIYGFQKAVFYNDSDIPVKGRFTYRFE